MSSAALSLVCLATLIAQISGNAMANIVAVAALAVYVAKEWHGVPWFGRGIVVAGVAVAIVAAWLIDRPWPVLMRGFAASTLLATFVTAMNLLREAARLSLLIKRCGIDILAQPPRRRSAALILAGQFYGVLTAFGVINLLGVMIRRGAAAGGAPPNESDRQACERRAMLAVLRGFGNTASWSPVAVPFAVVSASYPGLTWPDILPLGLATGLLLVAVGWIMDTASAGAPSQSVQRRDAASPDWGLHGRFGVLIVALFLLLMAVDAVIERSFILAAVIGLPVFAAAWIGVRYRRFGTARAIALTTRRGWRIAVESFPRQRVETTIIAGAGFIGVVVAAAVDPAGVAEMIDALSLPAAVIPIAAIWLILGLGHVGLNPVVVAAILVAAVNRPEAFNVPEVVFAVAVLGGWGLTQQSSPFNIPVILIGRLVGLSPRIVGHRWNGAYTVTAAVVLSLWIYAALVFWPG